MNIAAHAISCGHAVLLRDKVEHSSSENFAITRVSARRKRGGREVKVIGDCVVLCACETYVLLFYGYLEICSLFTLSYTFLYENVNPRDDRPLTVSLFLHLKLICTCYSAHGRHQYAQVRAFSEEW